MRKRAAVSSLAEARARRAAALPPQPTTHVAGMPVFVDGLCFAMQDVMVEEGTDQVCFENATIERHIRGVFARWGFDLADFMSSYADSRFRSARALMRWRCSSLRTSSQRPSTTRSCATAGVLTSGRLSASTASFGC